MKADEFEKHIQELTEDRRSQSKSKRKDYTKGSENVLQNFYNQAKSLGLTPLQSLGVHMEKQMSAVLNYIKTNGQSESEPIFRRIGDTINYLELMWGIIVEEEIPSHYEEDGEYLTREEISERHPNYPWKENGIDFAYDEPEYKYTEGDRVLIIDDTSGHFFEKWEIVTLENKKHGGWEAYNKLGDYWIVYEEDVKPLEQKETSRSFGI